MINGQKVWTTLAHVSDYGVIIARTDASVPKHAGISMFIVPLDAPGVEIRPIHQIDGGKHFNEIFFTDARSRPTTSSAISTTAGTWPPPCSCTSVSPSAPAPSAVCAMSGPTSSSNRRKSSARLKTQSYATPHEALHHGNHGVARLDAHRAELKAGKTPGPGGSLGKLIGTNNMNFARIFRSNSSVPAPWRGTARAAAAGRTALTGLQAASPAARTRFSATSSATVSSGSPVTSTCRRTCPSAN